jgi:hypothetical protein
MPHGMNRVHRLVVGLVGVILLLWVGLSWGGGPPNPTPSDSQRNTAGGEEALFHNMGGLFNTAFGYNALWKNETGNRNTATGSHTLLNNRRGDNNTASGVGALLNNIDGHWNTASGSNALLNNSSGANNTASGSFALANNTNGIRNTAIGMGAGSELSSGNDNIYLGSPGVPTESNTMRLGDMRPVTGQTRTFIAGVAGVTVSNSATVWIDTSTGQLGTMPSSARYKRDIQTMGTRSQGLLQLRPVTFRYKEDVQGERQYGLIAEEVAKVYPELVTHGADGEVESVRYHALIPMLLNEIQRQQQELAGQAWQLAELQAQHARLQAVVVQLQERDEAQRAQYVAMAAHLARLEEAVRAAPRASR